MIVCPDKKKVLPITTMQHITDTGTIHQQIYNQGFNACRDEFRKLNQNNGWISVEDRLPEYGKTCLFVGKIWNDNRWSKQYVMVGKRDCTNCLGEVFICLVSNVKFYDKEKYLNNITYWKPLPEPPLTIEIVKEK